MALARVEAVAPRPRASEARVAPPCVFVVFGATGDLTRRKLMPAMFKLRMGGFIGDRFAVLGVARRELAVETFRNDIQSGLLEFSKTAEQYPDQAGGFGEVLDYVPGEFDDPRTYRALAAELERLDRERGTGGNRLFYLATPPSEFEHILRHLREAGLITPPRGEPWTRVVLEKPFGRDVRTAMALNELVHEVLDESQTFRIDHYLGKETVQNILVFRFANSIFEPVWNRKYIDYVEICAAETIGIGSRGKFYDRTGVLRDIVQNHLLELLCLTAMEPPNSNAADDVRDEKLKVMRALRQPWSDTIVRDVVLGQYRGYRDEPDVDKKSTTPTYAALRVFVDNWRWQGVPFYLRAGKRLAKRATEISLHMQRVPHALFGREDVCENLEPNVLTLRIQPNEGIRLSFASKLPGYDFEVGHVDMDMTYVEAFGGEPPEAYERLLLDAMRGDAMLFSRRDAVEASWRWITPILDYFDAHPPRNFPNYDPGTWGPPGAEELLAREGRCWRRT